ncbi:tripartite tricarboxylate transporter substrate-binding protein [Cupriavidus basilensis]
MPDVPTLYEIFKDDDLVQESWIGVLRAPAGTPAPIVGRLFRATVQTVNSPEFKEAIARQGHVPVASDSPESFAGYVRSEYAKYARLARTAQLKPE